MHVSKYESQCLQFLLGFFWFGFFGEFFFRFLQVCIITVPGCVEAFSDLA